MKCYLFSRLERSGSFYFVLNGVLPSNFIPTLHLLLFCHIFDRGTISVAIKANMWSSIIGLLDNLKRDPLETQHPKFGNSRLRFTELMAHATSLTPPRISLSATLFQNKSVEPYSAKGPENVKLTLYRCTGYCLGPPHGT